MAKTVQMRENERRAAMLDALGVNVLAQYEAMTPEARAQFHTALRSLGVSAQQAADNIAAAFRPIVDSFSS